MATCRRSEKASQLAKEEDCTTPISSPSRRQLFATTGDGFSPASGVTAQHSPSATAPPSTSPGPFGGSPVGDCLAPLPSVQERMTRSAARRQGGPGLQAAAQPTPAVVQHAAAAVSTAHQSMAR